MNIKWNLNAGFIWHIHVFVHYVIDSWGIDWQPVVWTRSLHDKNQWVFIEFISVNKLRQCNRSLRNYNTNRDDTFYLFVDLWFMTSAPLLCCRYGQANFRPMYACEGLHHIIHIVLNVKVSINGNFESEDNLKGDTYSTLEFMTWAEELMDKIKYSHNETAKAHNFIVIRHSFYGATKV